jgi:hypothetical protein
MRQYGVVRTPANSPPAATSDHHQKQPTNALTIADIVSVTPTRIRDSERALAGHGETQRDR